MWIDFFFHRRKEGMYKINIKQSQSQFFGPFRQEAAIERISMERHSCRMCRGFFFMRIRCIIMLWLFHLNIELSTVVYFFHPNNVWSTQLYRQVTSAI